MPLIPIAPLSLFEEFPDASGGVEQPRIAESDDRTIAAVTDLYREILPAGGAILDVMSGWLSHLPPEVPYSRVVGIGLDGNELAENPFLDEWRVQDLNRDPCLPFSAGEFDGATLCVAVQQLTRPCDVIRDIGRILKPGAPLIVTVCEHCRPAQPIGCWCLLDETGRLCLIARHFAEAGNWGNIRCLDLTPAHGGDPLYAVIGHSLGWPRPGSDD